jgi:hypothetical protein
MTGWNFIGRSQKLSVQAPTGKEIGKKAVAPPVFTLGPANKTSSREWTPEGALYDYLVVKFPRE